MSKAGDIPVFASLYKNNNAGLLLGWINLTNLQANAPTNTLAWIKPVSPSDELYTNGFDNILSTQGAAWTNPPVGGEAIPLSSGQLVISNAGLFLVYSNISVTDNKLTNGSDIPTNSLTGSINPKTGLLTFSFGNGKGREKFDAYGAVLQDTTNAGGFFLGSTNDGAFILQP
jgi:hypothetical protein